MEKEIVGQYEVAPSMNFDGFDPYYHCRLEYDAQTKSKVVGRWYRGEYIPVNFGHQEKNN